MTGTTIITDALREIRVVGAAETPSADDLAFGLTRLNAILDAWNAEREAVYAEAITSFVLTPSLSPHTIGPTGTVVVAQRPVTVLAASILDGTIRTPLDVHHGIDWWAGLSDPALESTPTDLCYEPSWPNGSLYFWPVPSAADTVELYLRIVLAAADLTTTVTYPPGYQQALTLTLAEDLTPAFGEAAQLSALTMRAAAQARARIQRNNANRSRTVITTGNGLPDGAGWWDYRTGQTR